MGRSCLYACLFRIFKKLCKTADVGALLPGQGSSNHVPPRSWKYWKYSAENRLATLRIEMTCVITKESGRENLDSKPILLFSYAYRNYRGMSNSVSKQLLYLDFQCLLRSRNYRTCFVYFRRVADLQTAVCRSAITRNSWFVFLPVSLARFLSF